MKKQSKYKDEELLEGFSFQRIFENCMHFPKLGTKAFGTIIQYSFIPIGKLIRFAKLEKFVR